MLVEEIQFQFENSYRSTERFSFGLWFRIQTIRSSRSNFCFAPKLEQDEIHFAKWFLLANGRSDLPLPAKLKDLEEAMAFGNHKGAESNPEILRELIKKDVTHSYGLVLPLDKLKRIPCALLAPMNIMKQNKIDECGRIVKKDRLTHDQSYKCGSESSVNSRVNKDLLLPCKFGACLKRLINWAIAARKSTQTEGF